MIAAFGPTATRRRQSRQRRRKRFRGNSSFSSTGNYRIRSCLALNVVRLALPDLFQPYRQQIELAMSIPTVRQKVLTIAAMLKSMLADVDAGLVATLANAIRAETFDNFLDHAVAYQKESRKTEAGVIAAVVFENTMRKIYADKIDKLSKHELEQVIIQLTKNHVITEQQGHAPPTEMARQRSIK